MDRVLDTLLVRVLHPSRAALTESWRTELPEEFSAGYAAVPDGIAVLAAEVTDVARAVVVAEERGRISTALWLARALWPRHSCCRSDLEGCVSNGSLDRVVAAGRGHEGRAPW
ncbi:hypothetical protein WKI68_05640 [Streptomyces sp. MS1.HAVA.3]|uniref:Uncharacterized protein n=1 Tax=Streptomyces caledonius TaxID=3134107 RepID=A0ABU8U0Q5_9ACTN